MVEQLTALNRKPTPAAPAPRAQSAAPAPKPAGDNLALSTKVSTIGDKIKDVAEDMPFFSTWLNGLLKGTIRRMSDSMADSEKEFEARQRRLKEAAKALERAAAQA